MCLSIDLRIQVENILIGYCVIAKERATARVLVEHPRQYSLEVHY